MVDPEFKTSCCSAVTPPDVMLVIETLLASTTPVPEALISKLNVLDVSENINTASRRYLCPLITKNEPKDAGEVVIVADTGKSSPSYMLSLCEELLVKRSPTPSNSTAPASGLVVNDPVSNLSAAVLAEVVPAGKCSRAVPAEEEPILTFDEEEIFIAV